MKAVLIVVRNSSGHLDEIGAWRQHSAECSRQISLKITLTESKGAAPYATCSGIEYEFESRRCKPQIIEFRL